MYARWIDYFGVTRRPLWRNITAPSTTERRRFCAECRRLRVCYLTHDNRPRCASCSKRLGKACRWNAWTHESHATFW
jgi:hypothetical protein